MVRFKWCQQVSIATYNTKQKHYLRHENEILDLIPILKATSDSHL
jgi:hypothetical protein